MTTDLSKLYVVTCISNPVRYQSRYILYRKFAEMMAASGVKLVTVEQSFGDRPFVLTDRDNPMHLQVRSVDELWHKENMLNLGIEYIRQLDPDAKYIAWVDADVLPMRSPHGWFSETVEQLQHYEIVQMFEHAQDLDPQYNPIGHLHTGFVATYIKAGCKTPSANGVWRAGYYDKHGHPGYAWAANVSALDKVGGLIDFGVLGAGDRYMALGLVGCIDQSRSDELNPNFKLMLKQWEERAERHIKRDIGFVHGSIAHYWHGRKVNRGYSTRERVLIENQFDPITDLKRDTQGLYQLETHSERQIRIRDQFREYFRSRSEDCIYVGE